MKYVALLAALLLLGGCATSKSGSERNYDIEIENEEGSVVINIRLDNESSTSTEAGDAPVSQTTSPSTALGMQGSTATASGADVLLEGVRSLFDQYIDARQSSNVENPVQPTPQPPLPPVEPEEPGDVVEPPDPEGEPVAMRYWDRPNGRAQWYAFRPVSSFNWPVLFNVEGCDDLLVEADSPGWVSEERYEGGGWIIKESEVAGRGLTLLAPPACMATEASYLESY